MLHGDSDIDRTAHIAESAEVWAGCQIREGAIVGEGVILGRGVYVGVGVEIGSNSKIQNNALLYEPAFIGRGVFVGPGVILTNDRTPRAVTLELRRKATRDWTAQGVHIEDGASIGAGAVCVAPSRIGTWAMVAAGATVTADVKAYELVGGTPARHLGWVGRVGVRLRQSQRNEEIWICPETREHYKLEGGGNLIRVALD